MRRGHYQFESVPPGTYALSFRLLNFGDQQRRDLQVAAAPVTADAVLSLALSADVVVVAQADVRQPRGHREPGGEPRRRRAVGEPGRDHRAAARRAAAAARRRSARDGAGRDHHAAQRRGEGEPVFPARLQPRSRQRLRDDRRRHAGQHADPRAQPGLLRHQLHDPGARRRRAVLEGAVLRRPGRLRDRRRVEHQLRDASSIGRSCTSRSAAYGFGRALFAASPKVGQRAPARRRSRRRPTTVRGPCPTTYQKFNGVLRYTQGDSVNGFSLTGDGLSRQVERDRGVAGARGRRRADRSLRVDRPDRRRRHVPLQRRSPSGSTAARRDADQGHRATASSYDLDLISNFTFFLDDPVHGDQIEQVDHRFVAGAQGVAPAAHALERPRRAEHRSACRCATTAFPNVALYHTEKRVRLDTRERSDGAA